MATGVKFKFGATGYLIVAIYENSNPTALANISGNPFVYPPGAATGQANGTNVLVPIGLGSDTYTFKFYQSSNGTTMQTLLESWAIDGSFKGLFERFGYKVDRGSSGTNPNWADPTSDTTTLTDQRLIGAIQMLVFSKGVGLRSESDYTVLDTGGITLNNGEVFINQDEWQIVIGYETTVQSNNNSSNVISGINPVSANDNFDSTFYFKTNVAAFSTTNVGATAFPAFSSVPSGIKARFSTYGGSQRYWKLQFSGTDSVAFRVGRNTVSLNAISLGQNEILELEWQSGVCYVTDYKGDYGRMGVELNACDFLVNAIPADGTEYNFDDMGRFYDDYISKLPADRIVTYSQYNTQQTVPWIVETKTVNGVTSSTTLKTKQVFPYRGKFAVDTVNRKFKVPDRRGIFTRPLKVINTTDANYLNDTDKLTQGVGGYQIDTAGIVINDTQGNDGDVATTIGYAGGNPNVFQFKTKQKSYGNGTWPESYGAIPMIGI